MRHSFQSSGIERLEARHLLSTTLYVDASSSGATQDGSSWSAAYVDLQQALAIAVAGDQIHVAAGTYTPTTGADRTATFQLKSGVAIYGGYAGVGGADPDARDVALHPTILSGDIGVAGENTDNSYHVVTGSDTDSTAALDGFTITGGMADATAPGFGQSSGGGMLNISGSPTINGCIFTANAASGSFSGGGAMDNFMSSSPTITNCTFSQNSAFVDNPVDGSSSHGGAIVNNGASPIINHCSFDGNSAPSAPITSYFSGEGGAIATFSGVGQSAPVVVGSTFRDNAAGADGGAIYNVDGSLTLTDCRFEGNAAIDGGGVYQDGHQSYRLTATNCAFDGNTALGGSGGFGAGLSIRNSNSTIDNCAFCSNRSGNLGAGVYIDHFSAPTFVNSVFWGNSAPTGTQIYAVAPFIRGAPAVSESDIQGGWSGSGTGNIDADPQFVRNPSPGADGVWGTADDDYGDLHLQDNSPCINAGSNAAVPADTTTDLDGNERIVYDVVDMGSYEWHFPGDANGDRTVDTLDFNALAANFGGTNKTYGQGDFNYDGVVDTLDFNRLVGQFGKTLPPPAVPMQAAAGAVPISWSRTPIGQGDSDLSNGLLPPAEAAI